jgi:hypothetical protein
MWRPVRFQGGLMLSVAQRDKIRGDIAIIAASLGLTLKSERQIIENLADFPLVQVTFTTEGRRVSYWKDLLHDYCNTTNHQWTSLYGHIANATVSISIRSRDVEELHTKAIAFALAFWKQACNWSLTSTSKIEFRGVDPPKFLPPYKALDDRTNIYSCVIDFQCDYEFSWEILAYPITNIVSNTSVGILSTGDSDTQSLDEMIAVAPGCYVMSGTVGGNNSAYRMSCTIS